LTDLMFANESLRLSVVGTTPAVGSVVVGDTPPTEFVVRVSDPYAASSVRPGDLTVDGIPAERVGVTGARVLTSRFACSPVTGQGLETMAIADGVVDEERLRLADSGAERLGRLATSTTLSLDVAIEEMSQHVSTADGFAIPVRKPISNDPTHAEQLLIFT